MADAATNDGETLFPHIERLLDMLPELRTWIDTVLYDSACDHSSLKERVKDEFGMDLKTSLNPRRRQTIETNLPKGMNRLTPRGNLICNGGFEMDYKGARFEAKQYI